MKKLVFIITPVLWILTGIQIWNLYNSVDEQKVANAFLTMDFAENQGEVEGSGLLTTDYLSRAEKESLLQEIAGTLGITSGYTLETEREEDRSVTSLIKNADQALTTLQLITLEEQLSENVLETKTYLLIHLQIENSMESTIIYRTVVSEIFEDLGIKSGVNLNMIGTYAGDLSLEKRNEIADELLGQMNAQVVAEYRKDDLYTIYAYTKYIEDYEMHSGNKINIQLAASYDEVEEATIFYLATPTLQVDF